MNEAANPSRKGRPLKVHWWRHPEGCLNLGDELTAAMLTQLFDVHHVRAPMATADLISTGSILNSVWIRPPVVARSAPFGIVGSGFMHGSVPVTAHAAARIYSVRGHLSSEILRRVGVQVEAVGDPGLLVSRLHRPSARKRHRFGVIPHLSQLLDDAKFRDFQQRFEGLGDVGFIDFRTNELSRILDEMSSCEIIVSQGLHGLILSDALGIPNVWYNGAPVNAIQADFKFHDYFSSVGRPRDLYVGKSGKVDARSVVGNAYVADPEVIARIQGDIIRSYQGFFSDFGVAHRCAADV